MPRNVGDAYHWSSPSCFPPRSHITIHRVPRQHSYEVIRYGPEWRTAVARFLRHWWSSSAVLNEAHFDWKYLSNPYFDEALMYLAVERGSIAGIRGFIGSKWRVGDDRRSIVVPIAQDLFIQSEHRNTGLMQALTDFALNDLSERGFPFVINTTANEPNFMYCWSTGWHFTQRVDVAQWPQSTNGNGTRLAASLQEIELVGDLGRIKRLLRGSSIARAARRYSIATNLKRLESTGRGVKVLRKPLIEVMSRLVQLDDGRRPLRHARDAEYYRWRLDSPSAEHGFVIDSGEDPQGYLLLTWNTPTAMARVSAWATKSKEISDRLFAAVTGSGIEPIQTWTGTLSAAGRQAVEAAGFRPITYSRFRPCILTKELTPRETWPSWLRAYDLSDLSNWDIDSLTAMA